MSELDRPSVEPPAPSMPAFDVPRVSFVWPRQQLWPDVGLKLVDDARRAQLRSMLPLDDLPGSAWDAARFLVDWVSRQWEHNGWNDPGTTDPVEILQRVRDGERFRCVEYGHVLAGALAAIDIPSRVVWLRQPRPWEPLSGKGHVAMEAWISGLDRWVFLDAQLSGWWQDETGTPLSALELWERHARGETPATFSGTVDEVGAEWLAVTGHADSLAYWWDCFSYVSVGQQVLLSEEGTFEATFQQIGASNARHCLRPDQHHQLYPDLSAIELGMTDDRRPTVVVRATHPYAHAIALDGAEQDLDGARIELVRAPGAHSVEIAAVTSFGPLTSSRFEWEVAELLEPMDPPGTYE